MYPPPGSCQYVMPKPIRDGDDAQYSGESSLCDTCDCWNLTVIFKPKFWKLFILAVLVVAVYEFTQPFVFRRPGSPLFTVSSMSGKRNHYYFNGFEITGNREKQIPHDQFLNLTGSEELSNEKQNKHLQLNTKGNAARHESPTTSQPKVTNGSSIINSSAQHVPVQGKIGSRELLNQSVIGNKKFCPPVPPNLKGNIKPTVNNVPPLDVQERTNPEMGVGGRYRPVNCTARSKVAIIIPFRDRATHLAIFLYNIHPFLQRQQVDYTIYLIEQAGSGKFNRAMLMNVGSIEALKLYPYDCFIFHDVDLLPEDDRNLYTCPEQPRHMSVAINTMKYKLPYNDIFGGVSAMTVDHFKKVNGFSNRFWGWGGEDDDMSNRVKFHGFHISRYPANVARYTMMSHKKDKPNPLRYRFLHDGRKSYKSDGLSDIEYKVLDIQLKRLYTWIYVDLKTPTKKKKLRNNSLKI